MTSIRTPGAAVAPASTGASGKIVPRQRGFPAGHPFYLLSQRAVAAALHVVARVDAEGMENCPPAGSGPLVLASNHLSFFDIPLIGAWCPRPVMFFAKQEIRRWPLIGAIAAGYGTVFVRRGESDRQAIRDALASLAAGQVIGMFPEGHRSKGKGLLPASPGVALLAQRANAMVWPVAITGTERISKGSRPRVTIRGGEAFDPASELRASLGRSPTHQEVTDLIMERIAALLPPSYRGRP